MLVVIEESCHDDTFLLDRIIHGWSRRTSIVYHGGLCLHRRKPVCKTLLPLLRQEYHTVSSVQAPYKQFVLSMVFQLVAHVNMHDNLLSAK